MRDKSNPLALPEAAFRKRFRLSKCAFNYVLAELKFEGHLSTAVAPMIQLGATLSLSADFLIGICQSTICKIIKNVISEMETKLCPQFIKFVPDNLSECTKSFVEKYKIPGVIGCIDGTHFGLQKPTVNEHMFFNRKGYHSLNSMIICDHEYCILAIDSKCGGAAHDSSVGKHSVQRKFLEEQFNQNNFKNVWLLGDSGYPLEPWCLTSFRSPEEGSTQARFNEAHSKARCVVERTIGILKSIWKKGNNDKRSRYQS
ncbi:putative nuclease HARBI1 [Bactrocera neohumeralis]|uniref:putative nuclease HARBI1 n=1 Tax=Bactrocera neohumeralis TaxID=98809 RepID=UPI002166812F|nr:putative nuclease HARBI1 [Bactrocera neohumeralis]